MRQLNQAQLKRAIEYYENRHNEMLQKLTTARACNVRILGALVKADIVLTNYETNSKQTMFDVEYPVEDITSIYLTY